MTIEKLQELLKAQGFKQYKNQAEKMLKEHYTIVGESSPGWSRNVRLQFVNSEGTISTHGFDERLVGETIRAFCYLHEYGDDVCSAAALEALKELEKNHPVTFTKIAIKIK